MPSRAAVNGPSGSTQVPEVMAKTGARLKLIAAQNPARGEWMARPRQNISQVESANSAMKGRRAASGDAPSDCAAAASHQTAGG